MTTEARFWSRLKGKLGPGDFVRVENPCDPGTPDVNFHAQGREGWMELKFRRKPTRPSTIVLTDKHGLRPAQKLWIRRRTKVGGLVLIVVGIGDYVYLVPGRYAAVINDWTLLDFLRSEIPTAQRRDPSQVRKALRQAVYR